METLKTESEPLVKLTTTLTMRLFEDGDQRKFFRLPFPFTRVAFSVAQNNYIRTTT